MDLAVGDCRRNATRKSSASFATLAAIRRPSSRVSTLEIVEYGSAGDMM